MAEGDGSIHNQFKANVMKKLYNLALSGDTLKISLISGTCALTGTVGIANVTKHDGANYADKTLTGQAVAQDDSGNKGWLDADDVTWTALGAPGATTTFAVLWDDTVAGDPILAKWVITTQSNGGNFTITWAATGLINLT